jgi:hypothetical protein
MFEKLVQELNHIQHVTGISNFSDFYIQTNTHKDEDHLFFMGNRLADQYDNTYKPKSDIELLKAIEEDLNHMYECINSAMLTVKKLKIKTFKRGKK